MKFLLIAPYQMQADLLALYRKKDPFIDVKVVSKETLIGEWLGRCESKALNYLIKKYGYSYENARSIIPFLPFINEEIPDLYNIKQDLINSGLFIKNDYLQQFFVNKEILIHGYSTKDKELNHLLSEFSLKYRFIHNDIKQEKENYVSHYETAIDEVFYSLNKIASLLDSGVSIDDIYIYAINDSYLYYIEKFCKDFGFEAAIDKSFPLYTSSLTNTFIKEYVSSKDINSAIKKLEECQDEELVKAFKDVINDSLDEEFSFEQQLDFLLGELKRTRFKNKKYKNVVKLIDSPIYKENAHIFVMGFVQGGYPRVIKDNSFLGDDKKEILGMNTSKEETLYNEETLLDFFYSNNHFYFSYASRSTVEKYFPSPLIDKMKLVKVEEKFPNVIYSMDMRDFYYAKSLDLKRYYSETTPEFYPLSKICDIPYGQYDNQFNGVDIYNINSKLRYSYSSLKQFYQCPFAYYLSRLCEIDPFDGNIGTRIGLVAHKIFQHLNDEGFDFDKYFEQYVLEEDFLLEELPFVNNLKEQIRQACEAINLSKQHMKNPVELHEEPVVYEISDNLKLVGTIDKVIILDDKYISVVDYKTNNESFNPKYIQEGLSLQLPIYCLLLAETKKFNNYEICGVFINNVIDTSISHNTKEFDLIYSNLRLNGKAINNIEKISYLDDTILEYGKCKFIKGITVSKKTGELNASSSGIASKEEFQDYIKVAREKLLEADQRLRKNDFIINPYYVSKNNNGCMYCQYRDICFVKRSQRRYIGEESLEEEDDG